MRASRGLQQGGPAPDRLEQGHLAAITRPPAPPRCTTPPPRPDRDLRRPTARRRTSVSLPTRGGDMGRRRVAAVAVGVAVIGVLVAALAIGRTTAGTDAASSPAVAPGVAAPFNGTEVESGAGRAGMPAPPGSAPYAAVEPAPRDGAAASDGSTTAGSGD